MNTVKLLFLIICFSVFSSCSKSDPIYGSWSGKANFENSYTLLHGEPRDPSKFPGSMPLKGDRTVELTLSKNGCEIVFNSEYDYSTECIYAPERKTITIPDWRNSDSVYDSGLVILGLDDSILELKNEFIREYSDNTFGEYKHEMNGVELYFLTKNE